MSQNDEVIRVPQVFERENTGNDGEWFNPIFGFSTQDPALYFQKRIDGLEQQVQLLTTEMHDMKMRFKEAAQSVVNMP